MKAYDFRHPEGIIDLTEEMIAQLEANEALGPSDEEMIAADMRMYRSALLAETDWINGADVTLSDEKKAEWVAYRQALRDITSHENWPDLRRSDWPTKPT